MQHNSQANILVIEALPVISRAFGATNYECATSIDTRNFSEMLVILHAGTNTGAGTVDVTIRDSEDNSTFAALTGAAFTQVTTANDEQTYVGRIKLTPYTAGVNQSGTAAKARRYIQIRGNVGTANCTFGVTVMLIAPTVPAAMVDGSGNAKVSQNQASPIVATGTYAFNVD